MNAHFRNPRSITSLKSYLSDSMKDGREIDLEMIAELDDRRIARMRREGKDAMFNDTMVPVPTNQNNSKRKEASDYLSEIAGDVINTIETIMSKSNQLNISWPELACKVKNFFLVFKIFMTLINLYDEFCSFVYKGPST